MVENNYNPYYKQMPFLRAFVYYGITPTVRKTKVRRSYENEEIWYAH